MMIMDKPRCEICVHHELTPVGDCGKCRRYPPIMGQINTSKGYLCGEFKLHDDKLLKLKQKKQENK